MTEKANAPKPIGAARRGTVIRFTNCSTALRKNVCYPQLKPIPVDGDERWNQALYVWADVENAYGHVTRKGLLLPLKVIDSVLAEMYLPLLSHDPLRHKGTHAGNHWYHYDGDFNIVLSNHLLITALNRHQYEILWQCDDCNGRVVYEMRVK